MFNRKSAISPAGDRRQGKRRGSALIEITLIAPWFLFLSVGTLDVGIYSYSLIALENAVRVSSMYTSKSPSLASDQAGACTKVLAEMTNLPNLVGVSTCSADPLIVTASSVTGPDGQPASKVAVTYQTLSLIPIPGLMLGQMTITRESKMRVKP
jgi:Flp pilus assembly protein TadG